MKLFNNFNNTLFPIMLNTSIVGNYILHTQIRKFIKILDQTLPEIQTNTNLANLSDVDKHSITLLETTKSLSLKIYLVTCTSIALFATAYFGFFPGLLLTTGICLGSMGHAFMLIAPLTSRRQEINDHFDRIIKIADQNIIQS